MSERAGFVEFLRGRGLAHDEATVGRYLGYLDRLLATNEVTNLTAVRDASEAVSRHLEDSLELARELASVTRGTVVDLGTGGGLPGIPLAIARPDLAFVLVDAREKKIAFVDGAARGLGLTNVTALAARAETLGAVGSRHRASAAAVVSRALAPMPVLLELVAPLLVVGGALYAVKGERWAEEIAAAARAMQLLGMALESDRRTPTGTIVVLRKNAETPARYPRAPGEPKRKPL